LKAALYAGGFFISARIAYFYFMDIKSRIVELLEKEKYTFVQLADYLHMTEDGLTLELNNKTLELRNLEAISKALRVPLYSFFTAGEQTLDHHGKPYYINSLWSEDEQKSRKDLEREIDILKQLLAKKEGQLAAMGNRA
jgi:hypothetical protein